MRDGRPGFHTSTIIHTALQVTLPLKVVLKKKFQAFPFTWNFTFVSCSFTLSAKLDFSRENSTLNALEGAFYAVEALSESLTPRKAK